MSTVEEQVATELDDELSLQKEMSPAVLAAMKLAGSEVSTRVRRCMRISEKIDRKAVRLLGDEHLAHLVMVDQTLKHIGLATLSPENLTPAMAAHLEELFVITQPNYQLDAEQKQKVREYCAKNNTPMEKADD